jgi:hypothetical protein
MSKQAGEVEEEVPADPNLRNKNMENAGKKAPHPKRKLVSKLFPGCYLRSLISAKVNFKNRFYLVNIQGSEPFKM